MTTSGLCEFIARQLNDHEDCDHGTRQGTYHTWKEAHIKQALSLASSYLFSLKPDEFAIPVTYTTTESSCILDTSSACAKTLEVLSVGEGCDNVTIESEQTNDLLGMLQPSCATIEGEPDNYVLTQKSGSVYTSADNIPAGTSVTILCASDPESIDALTSTMMNEYQPLLVNFALWWLLLTDNESRSNQPRWEAYFKMVQWFVETKLLLEFSLSEDDYKYGRRRVND